MIASLNQKPKIAIVIPARLKSTRLKEKLLIRVGEFSIIQHTCLNAKKVKNADEIIVITDSEKIEKEIKTIEGKVILSKRRACSGTERIFKNIDPSHWDVVVNLQGDEPVVNPEEVDKFIERFIRDGTPLGTLYFKNRSYEDFLNPNKVKIVVGKDGYVLYFSRSPVPYKEEDKFDFFYHHIGIYAFKYKEVYKLYFSLESSLDKIEKLEQLKFLENGIKFRAYEYRGRTLGIDTEEDLLKFKNLSGV